MNRWNAASGLFLVGGALVLAKTRSRASLPLCEVFRDDTFQLTGVTVSKRGRFFVNYPRWSDVYLNAVVEVMPDGSVRPFPDVTWNRWNRKPDTARDHFVCVQSVVVDESDALWVLDPAAPMLTTPVPGGPKLVKIRRPPVTQIGPCAARQHKGTRRADPCGALRCLSSPFHW